MKHKMPVVMTGVALIIGGIYLASIDAPSEQLPLLARNQSTDHVSANLEKSAVSFVETSASFNEALLFEKTDAFIDNLMLPVDDSYRVENVQSIDELFARYHGVATPSVVKPYLDFYFTEEPTGVYLLPTELPPWFEKAYPYQLEAIDQHKISVTQENRHIELYGSYQIKLVFEWIEGQGWIIVAIDHS